MGAFFSMLLAGLKAILQLLAFLFKIVYNILKLFKVRILALYLVVCLVVQLIRHPFDGVFGRAYFFVGLSACILITLYAWTKPLREANKRRKLKKRNRAAESDRDEEEPAEEVGGAPKKAACPRRKAQKKCAQYPQYFDVADHPDFMFAEYADRYELYRKSENGFEYVRTDYKDDGGNRDSFIQ